MGSDTNILIATAFSVGMLHTLLGPDHYIPFVAMSKSNGWTTRKTLVITALCGLGHVAGSVVVGLLGIFIGAAVFEIETFEAFRGEGAAWLLIGFGLAYFVWGLVRAVRDVPHTHVHAHEDGTVHTHAHRHDLNHQHVHESTITDKHRLTSRRSVTPWVLFVIFVFGPCEVLVPLLMYPAAEANGWAIGGVVAAFTLATIGTMSVAVAVCLRGLRFFHVPNMHDYIHAISGFALLSCGMMVKFGF